MANTNENLVYGWGVQNLGATASQTGYAQPGTNPAVTTVSAAEQATSGAPQPAPAGITEVLTNPGYASSPTLISPGAVPAALVAVPATTVNFQNPTGLNCSVSVVGGTVTFIKVAPLVAGAAGTFTTIATATGATVSVPPGGFIQLTYSAAPTWVWVATN